MKFFNLLCVSASVLGLVGSLNAQTTIDITGSTAGRSAVHAAILTVLANETFVYNGSNFSGAGRILAKGDLGSGGPAVIIRTAWTGSAAGVRDVAANNASVLFINSSINTNVANNTVVAINVNNGLNVTSSVSEIAFSDVFQSSTIYGSPVLTDASVGIIPFKFYASDDAPASINNMTSLLARNIWGSGFTNLSFLTGNATDQGTFVYATGRDPDSGTRITTMAEIGYGVFNPVAQWQPTIGNGTVTAVVPWPAGAFAEGNGGYSSGSSVRTALEANASTGPGNIGGYLVSYVGSSDWSVIANELTYNGVAYSSANVIDGKYTFWGYLHQMGQTDLFGPASPTSTTKTFFTSLQTAVEADVTWLVKVSDMDVARDADGGLVNPLY